jgi:hypothetical protein
MLKSNSGERAQKHRKKCLGGYIFSKKLKSLYPTGQWTAHHLHMQPWGNTTEMFYLSLKIYLLHRNPTNGGKRRQNEKGKRNDNFIH